MSPAGATLACACACAGKARMPVGRSMHIPWRGCSGAREGAYARRMCACVCPKGASASGRAACLCLTTRCRCAWDPKAR
eukprot:518084-Alexandrium_andersonii.AAC.1